MSHNLLIMTFVFLVVKSSFAEVLPLTLPEAVKNPSIQKSIYEEPFVSATVSDAIFQGKKGQAMDFWAAGLHPKSCRIALRKLSRYEDYKDYLSFLELSAYDDANQLIYFRISTPIFPIKLGLRFQIPRITTPGVYPFQFKEGFLKDLKGNIHVSEIDQRCFFYIKSDWRGVHSGFANTLLEFFSKTIIKLGAEKLFRVTSF